MMSSYAVFYIIVLLLIIHHSNGISSPVQPYTSYRYSTQLQADVADLWWTVNDTQKEILFELHIKTTGWIALGISPAGGMKGADIGLGWVDQTGRVHFQDRYAYSTSQPVIDNTTTDWFALRGREQNGWTAIQFKRLLDTCDSMDVSIKSGTNILIFAYGLEDPDMSQPGGVISYHGDRKGSRIIPLQSYGNPPPEDKFAGLDYFDFQLKDYVVPSTDTTYHCKIYKAPSNYKERRHAIAHKTIIDSANRDLVHHLLMYECDPSAIFDDNNLPNDECDRIKQSTRACTSNIATGWAVGGDDIVEFPEIGGYPVGGDFEIKYYLVQMHYDNPRKIANRRDSSGIRFYVGKELRQHDLGYLSLGSRSNAVGIAIPPGVDQFIIDNYCPASVTQSFPKSGITVIGAFPHTHLQGRSVWTKIIRDKKAVDYLFNGEAYDFNYQFEYIFPNPIQLYPGDEFSTRCVYSTKNKSEITLGGESTKDEMCLHMFTYYPRMPKLSGCTTFNSEAAWQNLMGNSTASFNSAAHKKWLRELQWTPESIVQWQDFYNNAPRVVDTGRTDGGNNTYQNLDRLPDYEDLKPFECKKDISNSSIRQNSFGLFTLISLLIFFSS